MRKGGVVRFRGRAVADAGAAVVAVSVVGGSPTAAATPGVQAPRAAPTSSAGRHLEFGYTLAGGQCRLSIYALIVRNNYDPTQLAVFARFGDGKSKEVFFIQDLPFTPTQPSETGGIVPGGAGLCVIGVTTQGVRITDIAPDPQDAPCEPLKGGTARAFH